MVQNKKCTALKERLTKDVHLVHIYTNPILDISADGMHERIPREQPLRISCLQMHQKKPTY